MAKELKTITIKIVMGHVTKVEGDSILTEADIDEIKAHLEDMKSRLPKDN